MDIANVPAAVGEGPTAELELPSRPRVNFGQEPTSNSHKAIDVWMIGYTGIRECFALSTCSRNVVLLTNPQLSGTG
jgi:hypothetical protein